MTAVQIDESVATHLYGGPISSDDIYVRRGYLLAYNKEMYVPKYTMWKAEAAFRDTPKRTGRWKAFNQDPWLPDVSDDDYIGWYDSEFNYARGHMTPYFISGGDRNGNGIDAENEETLVPEDYEDACTVWEINSMANVAPQYHQAFNGQSGLWYLLETSIRRKIDQGRQFYIIAGTLFDENKPLLRIGRRSQPESSWHIGVPHGFFKLVIDPVTQESVLFVFDHAADLEIGCDITNAETSLETCIRPVEELEAFTGYSFFSTLSLEESQRYRRSSNPDTWTQW
jgi:DNA/RNA endonuclease G (NUC1)